MSNVKDLFSNLVHIGHKTAKWNPKIKPFIFGSKNQVHIFDLEKTEKRLEEAKKYLASVKLLGGNVLFVGTKPQAAYVLKKHLSGGKHFFVDHKWAPGLLTNFKEMRKRIDYYLNLKGQFESGEINKYTKKEIAKFKKDLEKLKGVYHGVAEMRKMPAVVVVLDAVNDELSIHEANKTKVPVIALVDSNANPDNITYPIPGNDDSIKSLDYIMTYLMNVLK